LSYGRDLLSIATIAKVPISNDRGKHILLAEEVPRAEALGIELWARVPLSLILYRTILKRFWQAKKKKT